MKDHDGVSSANVSLLLETAELTFDPKTQSAAKLATFVTDLGYDSSVKEALLPLVNLSSSSSSSTPASGGKAEGPQTVRLAVKGPFFLTFRCFLCSFSVCSCCCVLRCTCSLRQA